MQLIATDQKTVVVGLGITGLSCARYLSSRQKVFSVVDSRDNPPGLSELKAEFPDVDISLGGISEQALAGATELVVSPGVPLDQPAIAKAIKDGVSVCGDIDLFVAAAKAPVVAITGSNGKSTVTTLLGEMARAAGKNVPVGGNIGVPALELLAEAAPDFYILELSSFQLERARPLNAAVATVLNVSADHMDRYPDMVSYHQAKHRIFRGCRQAVVNKGDALSQPLVGDDVRVWKFGLNRPDFKEFGVNQTDGIAYLAFQRDNLMPLQELIIPGSHNVQNALAALALGHAMGLAFEPMISTLKSFTGLPHRCQFVAEYRGARYYNDSKGTNVGAAVAAIEGLLGTVDRVVLIVGGQGKGAEFGALKAALQKAGRAAVLIGEAADELADLLDGVLPLSHAQSMQEAVVKASELAEPGDAVLLSPACASFDMFNSFEHRGEVFMAAVQELMAA